VGGTVNLVGGNVVFTDSSNGPTSFTYTERRQRRRGDCDSRRDGHTCERRASSAG
jgi:hypothetical protein